MSADLDKKIVISRRRLLIALGATGTAGITALPRSWVKPVVDAVLIPLHAQASVTFVAFCDPDLDIEPFPDSTLVFPGNPISPGAGWQLPFGFNVTPAYGGPVSVVEEHSCDGVNWTLFFSTGGANLPTRGFFTPDFNVTCAPGETFRVRCTMTINGQEVIGECGWPVTAVVAPGE